MKPTILRMLFTGVLGVALCQGLALAQKHEAHRTKTTSGKIVTVTGCLQKGNEAKEYSITGADGKMYGLKSSSVKLADHLNHKVTVTGKMTKGEHEEKGATEAADLNVSSLKMVSTGCQ